MRKVGIIGCGNIAQVHGWVIQNMENAELVAVCDTDHGRAEELSKQFTDGRAEVYTDWHELCEAEMDVVHICTPHFLHAPMAVELLRHEKAVFMEKPCAISREQFAELRKSDGKHPGKLGFCFQNRYNNTTLEIDRVLAEGIIGDVRGARAFVTWRRDEAYYADSPWKGRRATEGGGALINQAVHTLDLLLRYVGRPERLSASVSNHHLQGLVEVEDTVEVWMSFEKGERACFYASNGYAADAPIFLELEGERGRITMNGSRLTLWTPEHGLKESLCESETGIGKDYWGCGHRSCIRDFYRCLEDGRRYQGDLSGVENTFDTMMRIYEAAEKTGA